MFAIKWRKPIVVVKHITFHVELLSHSWILAKDLLHGSRAIEYYEDSYFQLVAKLKDIEFGYLSSCYVEENKGTFYLKVSYVRLSPNDTRVEVRTSY